MADILCLWLSLESLLLVGSLSFGDYLVFSFFHSKQRLLDINETS